MTPRPPFEPAVEIVAHGAAAQAARRTAERKVRRVMTLTRRPVLHAQIKLSDSPNPAVERPALAEVTFDVNGQPVRAHVAAHTMGEAVDLVERRLRARLEHRVEREQALRRRGPHPPPAEWRRGQPASERPARYARAPEQRQVVRRKSFALDEVTVDEAAFDMDMLGFDFYLFQELATGEAAVLHRLPSGRYRLRRAIPSDVGAGAEVIEVEVMSGGAPRLTLDGALEWLNLSDAVFVFFRNLDTGRANVVYRRYDGHYGLITHADEPSPPAGRATVRRRLRDELERLSTVRATLLGEALDRDAETESVAELASIDQHQADLGTETFERERDLSLLQDVHEEIADVQRAFARLDRGTYGRCEACGARISDERLAAVPAARFCLAHQAAAEVIGGLT